MGNAIREAATTLIRLSNILRGKTRSQVLIDRTTAKLGIVAALLGVTGVALGALGAHALADSFGPGQAATFETAVRYQVWHALAILALCAITTPGSRSAGWLMAAGAALFSGSLYLLVLADAKWAGPITPVGGVLMIAGWVVLLVAFARQTRDQST